MLRRPGSHQGRHDDEDDAEAAYEKAAAEKAAGVHPRRCHPTSPSLQLIAWALGATLVQQLAARTQESAQAKKALLVRTQESALCCEGIGLS